MVIFEIDPNSDLPLWIQLRNRLVHLIKTGYFKSGDQLPTVRGLASDLSINYNTVNKAYLSMSDDGYINSTRGRGVFVRERDEEANESTLAAEALLDEFVESCRELGLTSWEIRKLLATRLRILQTGNYPQSGTVSPTDAKATTEDELYGKEEQTNRTA